VTKETVISFVRDGEESSSATDGEGVEKMMRELTLKERVIAFGGFKHQRELLEEVIGIKLMKE